MRIENYNSTKPLVVTFVFAHPDDEAIPFGLPAQLALEGNETHLLALTKGDLGSHHIRHRRKIARIRQREFAESGIILGARQAKTLGIRDGDLDIQTRRARKRLLKELRLINPDVVIVPAAQDYHQDHTAAREIGQWAAFHLKDAPIVTRRGFFGPKIPPTTKDVALYEMDTQGSQTWLSTKEDTGLNTDHLSPVNTILPVSPKAIAISTLAFEAHKSQLAPRPDGQLSYVELAQKGAARRGQQAGFAYGVGLNFIPFGGYAFSTRNVMQERMPIFLPVRQTALS